MKMKQAVRRRGERGIVIFLGVLAIAAVIPMVGISVDVGYLYASKARLQAAVDGASLAAARALNLGTSTAAQATNAKQNAVNWFYSNFPPGNWATTNTTMSPTSVQVYDDATNPNLRHVDVTASTTVPTYFMKWLHFNSTVINAKGFATRRDAVVMLVLDRSGSMDATDCANMKAAAKLFTGQFAAGRDYIGMVSFSDGVHLYSTPVQTFRTVLGYTDGSTSASGGIDAISCQGGTGSAQAFSVAYNALYQRYLPGAFNVMVFESDGLPNTLTMNMWDGTGYPFTSQGTSGSPKGCTDATGKAKVNGGWTTAASARTWKSGVYSMNTITANTPHVGFVPNIPAGSVALIYSTDPTQSPRNFQLMGEYVDPSGSSTLNATQNGTSGCLWGSGLAGVSSNTNLADFGWLPGTDVYGNSVRPALNPYQAVNMNGTRLKFDSTQTFDQKWLNYHNAALNATDNAAYRARSNANIPATVFVIGLGGNGEVDHTLLQRMANDTRGDTTVTPNIPTCAANPSCVHYDTQPQGTYIFSSDSNTLRAKFLELSSQILRLSQ